MVHELYSFIRNGFRSRLGLWTSLLVAVLVCVYALYIVAILETPFRTPVVMLTATYRPPWDVNPWAAENIALLTRLDGRNLETIDAGDCQQLANGIWTNFDKAIRQADRLAADQPLIIYANLHGAVNDLGQPCLVPPSGTVYDWRSWLLLERIIERAAEHVRSSRTIHLFLECGRINHVPGITGNSRKFADSVEQLIDRCSQEFGDVGFAISDQSTPSGKDNSLDFAHKIPGLTITVSAAQRNATSADVNGHGDTFTRFLASGLAGAADLNENFGNADGKVEFGELSGYIQRHVAHWTGAHRNHLQLPTVFQAGRIDPVVTWCLPNPTVSVGPVEQPDESAQRPVASAWQRIDRLRAAGPWERQPAKWAELNQQVVALEQATFGGRAARSMVPELAKSVDASIAWLEQQSRMATSKTGVNQLIAEFQKANWQRLADNPTPLTALEIRKQWTTPNSNPLMGVPVIELLSQDPSNPCWAEPETVERYCRLRSKVLGAMVNWSSVTGCAADSHWQRELSKINMRVADKILTGAPLGDWEPILDEYESGSQLLWQRNEFWANHMRSRNRSFAEAPCLAGCLLDASRGRATEHTNICDKLLRLTRSTAAVNRALHAISTMSVSNQNQQAVKLDERLPILPDLSEMLDELVRKRIELWEESLQSGVRPKPQDMQIVEGLLRYAWQPESTATEIPITDRIAARLRISTWENQLNSVDANSLASTDVHSNQPDANRDFAILWSEILGQCDEKADPERCATYIRDCLRQVASGHEIVGHSSNESMTGDMAEYLFRASAAARWSAGVAATADGNNSIDREAGLRKQQRLSEFAWQVMDEFWALPIIDSQPYFAAVAERALREADSAFPPSDTWQQRLSKLRHLLDERVMAAGSAFELTAQWLPAFEQDNRLEGPAERTGQAWASEIQISPRASSVHLPNGLGVARIRSGDFDSRVTVPLDNPEQPLRVSVHVDWLDRIIDHESKPALATFDFRGHVYSFPFDLRPISGATTAGRFSAIRPATLIIEDHLRQSRGWIFVLDCSSSMNEKIEVEGVVSRSPTAVKKISKLDAAKLAVTEILRSLSARGEFVSFILYGHRVADGTDRKRLVQPRYAAKYGVPETITASDDVEIILPLGRFGERELSLISERLDQIVPWGQSPLFLSLATAIEAIQSNSGLGRCDIVAISDGQNYQFSPPPQARISVNQVIQRANDQRTPIHVIGFGTPVSGESASEQLFTDIASRSGGSAALQITDATGLVDRLRTLVTQSEFQITLPDGSRKTALTNSTIELPVMNDENATVLVHLYSRSQLIPIDPGSSVALVTMPGGELVSKRSSGDHQHSTILTDAQGQTTQLELDVHQPQQKERHVTWTLSLHSLDGAVPRRPSTIIVEVEPLFGKRASTEGNSNSTHSAPIRSAERHFAESKDLVHEKSLHPELDQGSYTFVDATWLARQPSPTIDITTEDWPPTASSARIWAWMSYEPIPPASVHVLDDRLRTVFKQSQPCYDSAEISGLSLQIQATLRVIDVMLVGRTKGVSARDWIPRVSGVGVDHVRRRFSELQNASYHSFERVSMLDDAKEASSASYDPRTTIELYSLALIKQHALRVAKPIEISLAKELAALPPSTSLR